MSRRGYSYERLSSYSELEDKDVIRVVLRNPNELVNPQSVNFGSRSYNPLISHSKQGLSKFYSILKFLVNVLMNTIIVFIFFDSAHQDLGM